MHFTLGKDQDRISNTSQRHFSAGGQLNARMCMPTLPFYMERW